MVDLNDYPWLISTYNTIVETYHNNKSHHAYLFIHTGDVGQEILLDKLSKLFICSNALEEKLYQACGACRACVANNYVNPDLIELENKNNVIPVDSVREMISKTALYPSISANNVVVIHGANYLNSSSANAMLKNLEEPNTNTKYLLRLDSSDYILPTIRSRCMVVNLPSPSLEQLKDFCLKNLIDEDITLSLSTLVGYQPDLILSMHNKKLTSEIKPLGLSLYQTLFTLEAESLKNHFLKFTKDVELFIWNISILRKILTLVIEVKTNPAMINDKNDAIEELLTLNAELSEIYASLIEPQIDIDNTVTLILKLSILEKQIRNFTPQLGGEKSLEAIAYKISAEMCLWCHNFISNTKFTSQFNLNFKS